MPAERTDLLPGPVSEALTAQTGGREGARDGERARWMAAVQGGLGRVETGLASQAARRVSPGYFRSPSPAPSAPAGKHQRGEGNE